VKRDFLKRSCWEEVTFLKKSNQKTFALAVTLNRHGGPLPPGPKVFLVLFLQKKNIFRCIHLNQSRPSVATLPATKKPRDGSRGFPCAQAFGPD
jgi:hypothetical protein